MKTFESINELFTFTDEEISSISDEKIQSISYGIKYFNFYGDFTPRKGQILALLSDRLKNIESKKEVLNESKEKKVVLCDCGHEVEKVLVMSASFGSCCADCYDDMIDILTHLKEGDSQTQPTLVAAARGSFSRLKPFRLRRD